MHQGLHYIILLIMRRLITEMEKAVILLLMMIFLQSVTRGSFLGMFKMQRKIKFTCILLREPCRREKIMVRKSRGEWESCQIACKFDPKGSRSTDLASKKCSARSSHRLSIKVRGILCFPGTGLP